MKLILNLVGAAICAAAFAQNSAEMNKLHYFVGEWTAKGTMGPPTSTSMEDLQTVQQSEWSGSGKGAVVLKGRFVELSVTLNQAQGQKFEGKALLTYDEAANQYMGFFFSSENATPLTTQGRMEGGTLALAGTPYQAPSVSARVFIDMSRQDQFSLRLMINEGGDEKPAMQATFIRKK